MGVAWKEVYVLKDSNRIKASFNVCYLRNSWYFSLTFSLLSPIVLLFFIFKSFAFCWLTHFSSLWLSVRNDNLFTVYWTTTLWSATVELLLLFGQLRCLGRVQIHLIWEEFKLTLFIWGHSNAVSSTRTSTEDSPSGELVIGVYSILQEFFPL